VWAVNPIILPQQGSHCVSGWLEKHDAVVLLAAHQDLVIRHCNDVLQQWAGERLEDVEAGIYLCTSVIVSVSQSDMNTDPSGVVHIDYGDSKCLDLPG